MIGAYAFYYSRRFGRLMDTACMAAGTPLARLPLLACGRNSQPVHIPVDTSTIDA
jgi:hypothetical protein